MKKLNSLAILFVITVVMVVLMVLTIQRPSNTNDDEGLLLPGLLEQLGDIDSIQIKSNQDEFTVYKQGERWLIKERWNFPADFSLVKRALVDLSEAKILERKTADPEQYAMLSVDGTDEGGESVLITMLKGDTEVSSLLLGRERELGQTSGARQFYVRRPNETQSWLAEGYLNINPLMLNWIQSEVINIARERIAKVDIIQPSGSWASIINVGKKDKFGIPGNHDDAIFKYKQLGYDIAGSLFQLRMEDVLPVSDFSRGGAEVVTAEFFTFDGLKLVTKTSFNADDGFYYSILHAESGKQKDAPADIQQLNVLKTAAQIQEEIESYNTAFSPWVYRFSGFVGTNLMRAKADIVTEVENVIPMPIDSMGFSPE